MIKNRLASFPSNFDLLTDLYMTLNIIFLFAFNLQRLRTKKSQINWHRVKSEQIKLAKIFSIITVIFLILRQGSQSKAHAISRYHMKNHCK